MANNISSSMFRKLKDFLVRNTKDNGDISPAEAHKIQEASYLLSKTEVKKNFSPTYLRVVSDLDSPQKQVVEATVYYLVRIAQNKPQYKDEIKRILHEKMADKRYNSDFKEMIDIYLRDI